MRRTALVIAVVFLPICVCAAVFVGVRWTFSEDETSPFWGGYERGQVLRLNFDVFVVDSAPFGWPDRWALVPAGSVALPYGRLFMAPSSIAKYREHGSFPADELVYFGEIALFPPDVKGVAEKGIMVEIARLRRTIGWSPWAGGGFTTVTVWGRILDGPMAGVLVDMSDVSTSERVDGVFVSSPFALLFDPKYYWDEKITPEMCSAERHPNEPDIACD